MDSRRPSPPTDPEPKSYSYDEMMDRLRHQRSGSERRVTIESPEGPVEVRKRRRRRSHQPKKAREERAQKLKKLVLLAGVPIVLLSIGAYLLFQARYESEGFKSSVGSRVSEIIQAQTEFDRFKVNGLTIKNSKMHIAPPAGAILRDAEFTSLSGRLTTGSMMSSGWSLEAASALRGTFNFHSPRSSVAGARPGAEPLLQFAGLGLSKSPSAFEVEKLYVGSAKFNWFKSSISNAYTFIEETKASTGPLGSETEIDLSGGTFRVPGWPECDIDRAALRYRPGIIEVTESLLSHRYVGNTHGKATLSGSISLGREAPLADLICLLEGMPASSLVRGETEKHLGGAVDATLSFKANLKQLSSLVVSGTFKVRDGMFGDVAPLKSLAAFLAEPRLSPIQFHKISGSYTLQDGISEVSNLDAIAPGLIQISGDYRFDQDDILSGNLRVGIAELTLSEVPGGPGAAKEIAKVFGEADPTTGMLYTDVELSGTRKTPLENLTPRIEAAIEKFHRDSAAPPASSYPTLPRASGSDDADRKSSEDAFNDLIKPD